MFRFPEARVRNREDGREPREGLPSLPDGATARAEALSAGPLEVPSEDEQRDANAIFSLEKNPSPPRQLCGFGGQEKISLLEKSRKSEKSVENSVEICVVKGKLSS